VLTCWLLGCNYVLKVDVVLVVTINTNIRNEFYTRSSCQLVVKPFYWNFLLEVSTIMFLAHVIELCLFLSSLCVSQNFLLAIVNVVKVPYLSC